MTQLTIEGVGFPPYATNNCTQILKALPQGTFVRSLRGELVFLGAKGFHKYETTLEGWDQHPPALGNLYCGQVLTLHAMERLFQQATADALQLSRPPVPESLYAVDRLGESVPLVLEENAWVRIQNWTVETDILISYCPILQMGVKSFSIEGKGEGSKTRWRMILEEV